ncbi:zinc-dependent alcohol dehydrogenase family protein [Picrophilus oshimae]|uniref:Alcohol dehydrogenase n=1 Tax=Picrophilus torridus (strain ATCC 700027 / DSM 9790 / JCM 10055 / NBRC 100828 / KAW 2/3) TaxID=1122961 RepID=Q6KZL8_PICTO|nr:zinc-dependent alcohol dehydrogenase family protein [Picrophilus oshimae]AAT43834.1 alcohol dehydrogenase [Picrophilus oshimae DSM 9789]SMD31098.1 alcohol dehydrogenase, propanol-preferring [Picrophilus oshimae DSM 9789]
MKAMVLEKVGKVEENPLKYKDVDIKKPEGFEILIKNLACGVCHSNLHMIEGDWVQYGLPGKSNIIPGHEIIGRVEELGDNVTDLKKGDIVGLQPLYSACGKCEYCLSGREHLCPYGKWTGETVDGGYAEYMIADSRYVNKVPSNIDPVNAPLFCPGVTAYTAVKKAELSPDKTVYIVGIGGVGHIALQIAKLYGSRVVAVTTSKNHEDLAYKMGADDVVIMDRNYENADMLAKTADAAIIFAPADAAIKNSIKFVKDGGVVVQGVRGNQGEFDFTRELKIKGSKIGTRQDMNEVLKLAADGKIKVESKTYKLEEANEALKALKHGEVNGRAVLKMY